MILKLSALSMASGLICLYIQLVRQNVYYSLLLLFIYHIHLKVVYLQGYETRINKIVYAFCARGSSIVIETIMAKSKQIDITLLVSVVSMAPGLICLHILSLTNCLIAICSAWIHHTLDKDGIMQSE